MAKKTGKQALEELRSTHTKWRKALEKEERLQTKVRTLVKSFPKKERALYKEKIMKILETGRTQIIV